MQRYEKGINRISAARSMNSRGCSIGRCSSFSTGSGAANKHVAAFRSGQPLRRNHEARKVDDAFERADPEVCRLLAQHIEAMVRVTKW